MGSQPETEVQRFRDLLLGCLEGRDSRSAADMALNGRHAYLVYLPDETLLATPPPAPGADLLDAVDRLYASANPGDLYRHAHASTPSPVPRAAIETALTSVPLTVVAFPGIFGEFINVLPFDEVARNQTSAYAREWQRLLQEYQATHSDAEVKETLWDEHFSLAELRLDPGRRPTIRRKLEDLFAVSSIDDVTGRPLVRLVVFRHHPDSLETVSALADITPVLSARLAKFFAVAGVPENVVLLGYSMGADVALDVAATAHAAGSRWIEHLRAVVTVGGVVHGSHIADSARAPSNGVESSLHRQVRLLEQITNALEETASLPLLSFRGLNKVTMWWRNLTVWRHFLPDISALLADATKGGKPVSSRHLLKLIRRSDFSPTLSMVLGLMTQTLRLLRPGDYSLNIRKLKKLVAATLAGVDNLTTQARRDWWRSHVLPTRGVRYYAITGTMPGDALDVQGEPLIENAEAFAFPSIDLTFLARSYEDYLAISRQALNDGQVSASRAQFWPELLGHLNPHYRDHQLDGYFLGVLGEHHWGIVLSEVNHLKGDLKNPFPRTALLEALAAQVASDIAGKS